MFSKIVEITTFGPMELHPLRDAVMGVVAESGVRLGSTLVSVEGATPALVLLEKGLERRFVNMLEKLVPYTVWRHGNAYAHLVSTMISTSLVIPVVEGSLALDGDYEVYLLETRAVHNHRRRLLIYLRGS
ncbi:MAG: YjbQ family protein [Ignisphaera sp.]|nr:YjbQ family protein [Ignisphaera sp.]MDW8085576.1 YjbQ family protein [Ignisphaera sp.]